MMKEKGFTLAEALIVLVIIGVIAALTIPAVLINTEQNEYKTAFKKAVSSINEAVQLNIALNGEGPDQASTTGPSADDSLFNMLRSRMSVVSTSDNYTGGGATGNYAFFTTDGMRFEFPTAAPTVSINGKNTWNLGHCGVEGDSDSAGEAYHPCFVVVDVNGERKPNPVAAGTAYKYPSAANEKSRFLDVYSIAVTDKNAYPLGTVAQRAFFQAD